MTPMVALSPLCGDDAPYGFETDYEQAVYGDLEVCHDGIGPVRMLSRVHVSLYLLPTESPASCRIRLPQFLGAVDLRGEGSPQRALDHALR